MNRELVRKVAARIRQYPALYDQEHWAVVNTEDPCKTPACIAGETLICAYGKVEFLETETIFANIHRDTGGVEQVNISSRAASLLDLTSWERSFLFCAGGRGKGLVVDDEFEELPEEEKRYLKAHHAANALERWAKGADIFDVWTTGSKLQDALYIAESMGLDIEKETLLRNRLYALLD